MENNTPEDIWAKLKSSKRVIISLHDSPDGDSLGSSTAFKMALENEGIEVRLVSYDEPSGNLKRFPYVKEVEFGTDISEVDLNYYDLILCLDSGSLSVVSGKLRKEFNPNQFIINIDHHNANNYYGDLNYIDSHKSSCCSVLIDFFNQNNIEIDCEIADRLLLGVTTDSLFFTIETGDIALKEANFLIQKGANYNEVVKNVLYNQPLRLKKYFALIFNKVKINKEKCFAYSLIEKKEIDKLKLNESEIRLGSNELQFIEEFKFIFTLVDMGNYVRGSFRSKKGIDVSLFARELGGGGHKSASAFILKDTSLKDAEKKVLEKLEKLNF